MSKKIKGYWDSLEQMRASLPNLIRPTNIFREEKKEESKENIQERHEEEEGKESAKLSDLSITQRINANLLKYKEIRLFCNKTGMQPAILLYILLICLFFILVGYLQNYLTVLIATLYPMYISIKTLQNSESTKQNVTQWLTYWYIINKYKYFNI
jgi:hypothetical protein